jgi:drug/metabolite transporter (DMT)-like permease
MDNGCYRVEPGQLVASTAPADIIASAEDAAWFDGHLGRDYQLRRSLPGELGTTAGALVAVRQATPGCRLRLPFKVTREDAHLLLVEVTPSWSELGLFMAAGLLGGTSFLVLAHALKLAPAATIAPFQYTHMTYAILVGLLIFGDVPDPANLVGAAVIIASGLFVLRLETRGRAAATVEAVARLP